MEITYKIHDDFSIEIYQNGELVIHQCNNPATQKPFSSEEESLNWYNTRGFYFAGGSRDENSTSSEA